MAASSGASASTSAASSPPASTESANLVVPCYNANRIVTAGKTVIQGWMNHVLQRAWDQGCKNSMQHTVHMIANKLKHTNSSPEIRLRISASLYTGMLGGDASIH
jgi:hypothetical protein